MTATERLAAAAKAHRTAQAREEKTRAVLYDAIRDAVADGMAEAEAARIGGVDRMTVRKILGKR